MEVEIGVLERVSNLVGSSEAGLKLLLSVLAGYPIAQIHRTYLYGRNANYQHLYFLLSGLTLGFLNYGRDILHPLSAVLVTYATVVLFRRSALSVVITFVFNMTYLLMGYYYVGTNDYDINWTMPQCIIVLRLIGLAFDLYDGQKPPESLSGDGKKVALREMPQFLETLGFVFFPTSFLVGPQFPLKRYQEFIEGKFGPSPGTPPQSVHAAVRRFLLGVGVLSVFLTLSQFTSDDYIMSDAFRNRGILMRYFELGVWGRFTLYKYISCWLLTEGACILFGITHNGVDEFGAIKWNGVENVKVSLLESATEFNHYILSFNINTNSWVAHYVYKRLKFLGSRYYSQAISLIFLAVWHGFHSGYYVCFAFEFIVMYLERDVRQIVKSNQEVSKFLQRPAVSLILTLLQRVYTFVFMGWCLLPFALLKFERYWLVFGSVNYVGLLFFLPYPILYRYILKKLLKTTKRD
ncbi:hypothetical protein PPYR_09102 [Photinus pyralis]|uniref:Lysophospholipid acyltransferase 5 n=1 Tax=Photinus pyralis TaxID=7054 RepID=A0A5N4ALB4_PHOPY|nr:lysophospholipid acyltransferase 5 [Photinus pyralis]KAB0798109.1 hypothetical protein PPYR_09102 [Photinus pyralis]